MLNREEKAERERLALQQCALFEEIITEIINAGFEGSNPFLAVRDINGELWPTAPRFMTRDNILEYVRHRFGELFVGFCLQMPQFIVH
jgi:hypothetical protein